MSNEEDKSEVQGRTEGCRSGGQWEWREGRLLGRVRRCQGEEKGRARVWTWGTEGGKVKGGEREEWCVRCSNAEVYAAKMKVVC